MNLDAMASAWLNVNNTIAIIPARSGSSRVPDKNIMPFCGRPMIAYPLAAARESAVFDKIHVSTNSSKYASIVEDLGFPVDFLRDPSMAENNSSLLVLIRWILDRFEEQGKSYRDICLLFATAPLIEAKDLVAGYRLFQEHGSAKPVISAGKFQSPIERAMKMDDDGMLRWYDPNKRLLHSQQCLDTYFDAGAFVFFGKDYFFEGKSEVFDEFHPFVLPSWKVADINDPEDLELARTLFLGRQASAWSKE